MKSYFAARQRNCWRRWILIALLPALLGIAACGSRLPTADTGSVPEIAQSDQSAPTLAVTPTSGHAGLYVQVIGSGWPRNMLVVVMLADATGRSATLASTDTNSSGELTTGFLYPIDERWLAPGVYQVIAETADGQRQAATNFTVDAPGNATPLTTTETMTDTSLTAQSGISATVPTATPLATMTLTPTPLPEAQVAQEASLAADAAGNNRPPVVEAQLVPLEERGEPYRYRVVFAASDPDGNLREVVAVIKMPPLTPEHDLELKVKEKIEIKLHPEKAEIGGPDPQALLEQIRRYGGIVVQNGQIIEVKLIDSPDFNVTVEEMLVIEAQSVVLHVVAIDTEGESTEAVASPVFAPEEDEDDNDEDDNGDDTGSHVTNKDACKKGGWQNLTREDGSAFKNQGDCIQYVNTGK